MSEMSLFELAAPAPDPVIVAHPVGSVIETANGAEGLATATYDTSREFRYRLSRVWDPSLGRCVFVMLNPSTATAMKLDATVTRCVRFAKSWGFGAVEIVNIFAFRSRDPKLLYSHQDPVGPGNDEAIVAAGRAAGTVVAAWGVHSVLNGRGDAVRSLLAANDIALHYLIVTKDGHPGHPLYIPAATPLTLWT